MHCCRLIGSHTLCPISGGLLKGRVVLWIACMDANRFTRLQKESWVMTSRIRLVSCLCLLVVCGAGTTRLFAQCCQCCYRMVCKTVCEERTVTCYKQVCETVCEPREITRQVPVWETEKRERRFKVVGPVQETSMREERFCVQRRVYET